MSFNFGGGGFGSGSSKKKESDRESAIRAQQRHLAARISKSGDQAANKPSPSPVPSSNVRPVQKQRVVSAAKIGKTASSRPIRPVSNQAALLKKQKQVATVKSLLAPDDSPKPSLVQSNSSVTAPKRPVLRNRKTTAEAALAAARSRVGKAGNEADVPPKGIKSAILSQARKKTAFLGSLVSASIQTSSSAGTSSSSPYETSSSYGVADPEDYWKNVRDWDFLTQYCKEVGKNKQPPRRTNEQGKDGNTNNQKKDDEEDQEESPMASKKPLPDVFISERHYIASWAPLILAENRAQLLSEVLSSTRPRVFHTVTLHTAKRNLESTLDNLILQCRGSDVGGSYRDEISFMTNDVCLLVPKADLPDVERLMKKGLDKSDKHENLRSCGMLGHVKFPRHSVDGLQLCVSKRWFARIDKGKPDEKYGLLRLGNNITSFREFTALCRLDMLPLKDTLMGKGLQPTKATTLEGVLTEDVSTQMSKAQPRSKTKAQMLMSMGGVAALGAGFTKYAQKKFNPSQMQAISAAAHEYGDGGFTLIKGPPGTGKVCA